MTDGRIREEWARTSAVLAMLANTVRDPKKKPSPYTAAEFNPFREHDRRAVNRALPKVKLSSVKGLLMGGARRITDDAVPRRRS